jgi:hypothetical protein
VIRHDRSVPTHARHARLDDVEGCRDCDCGIEGVAAGFKDSNARGSRVRVSGRNYPGASRFARVGKSGGASSRDDKNSEGSSDETHAPNHTHLGMRLHSSSPASQDPKDARAR